MKIVVDSDIPYLQGILEPFARVVYLKGEEIQCADIADADGLIVRTRTRCDGKLLDGSSVKFIATATIGFDHIDIEYCRANNIAVSTSAGCNARGVLQWVGAVLAATAKAEGWQPEERCLGVVGVGNVGTLVAEYAERWGFRVVCSDPPRQRGGEDGFIPFEELTTLCDIVTFHVPLNRKAIDRTIDMADTKFFSGLKHGSMVINASRGEVVDEEALKNGIKSKNIGCAIDTWHNEPHIDPELLSLSSYATQHIAGYSTEGKAMATAMVVNSLSAYFALPLSGWYPQGVAKSQPKDISWCDMQQTIKNYLDIDSLTAILKNSPSSFEELRCSYKYRNEHY